VDLSVTDKDGRNIAQIAVESEEENSVHCLEILCQDPRVNWNIKNLNDETPLMYTWKNRKEEMFKILKTVASIDTPEFLQDCYNAGNVSIPIPECPVCYNNFNAQSHVYLCTEGHWVCGDCRDRVQGCPMCRSAIVGRAHDFEKFLQSLTI